MLHSRQTHQFLGHEIQVPNIIKKVLKIALDFEFQAILPERTKNLSLRFSLKIKFFA